MRFRPMTLSVALFFLAAGASRADDVYISPPTPTTSDTVWVVVNGMVADFWTGDCGGPSNFVYCPLLAEPGTYEMMVENYFSFCSGGGGCNADCVVHGWSYRELGRCELGTLGPGHYTLNVDFYEDAYGGVTHTEVVSFDVAQVVSVAGAPSIEFGIAPPSPNPSRSGSFAATVSLASDEPATATLHDLAGRFVSHVDLGTRRAGRHVLRFGEGNPLSPGLYFLRLTQGRRVETVKTVVLR